MPATFDGDNLLITLPTSTAEIDAKVDLYSDWKEWFKTSPNAKYPLAFDTVGGDPTTATGAVAAYYFLRNDNGWRIKPAEEDAEVTIVGNLYPRDVALPVFAQTTGAFTVLLNVERDASSVVETVISGSGVTAGDKTDIIDGVWSKVLETLTAEEIMRITLAALAGKRVGLGTATEQYMGQDDVKARITLTPDQYGNGDPTLDGTP